MKFSSKPTYSKKNQQTIYLQNDEYRNSIVLLLPLRTQSNVLSPHFYSSYTARDGREQEPKSIEEPPGPVFHLRAASHVSIHATDSNSNSTGKKREDVTV